MNGSNASVFMPSFYARRGDLGLPDTGEIFLNTFKRVHSRGP